MINSGITDQLRVVLTSNLEVADTDDPKEAKREALRGLEFCIDMKSSLRELTQSVVDGARRNGASWTEIGRVQGISRQAAQKMYGGLTGMQGQSNTVDSEIMTLYPITAFDEMSKLEALGARGWRLIGVGLQSHKLVRDIKQWQYKRSIIGSKKTSQLDREGWERVSDETFPWVYFAQPMQISSEEWAPALRQRD